MALKIVLIVLLVILAFPILWVTLAKVVRKLVHFPAPAFIGRLLDSGLQAKDTAAGSVDRTQRNKRWNDF
jgi:hypothetical protein